MTRGGICVPPTVIYLPYRRVSGSTLTAVYRAFSVAGPMAWNSLPDFIRDPTSSVYLKRTCPRVTSAFSALRVLNDYALYKSTHSLTHSITHSQRDGYTTTTSTALAQRREVIRPTGVVVGASFLLDDGDGRVLFADVLCHGGPSTTTEIHRRRRRRRPPRSCNAAFTRRIAAYQAKR